MMLALRRYRSWEYALAAMLGLLLWLFASVVYSWDLGGFISEKLIERQGTTNSLLVVQSGATNTSDQEVGMAPIVSTSAATNVHTVAGGTMEATMWGNVSDMNGFPSATGWFEWGYDGAYDHTTTTQALAAVGDYSLVVGGMDSNRVVTFRAVVRSDGTARGSGQQFQHAAMATTNSWLASLLPVLVAMAIVFVALQSGNLWMLLGGVAFGIVGYAVVQELLRLIGQ